MASREPAPEHLALLEKMVGALTARGILTEADLASKKAATERASPAAGAAMVARAWVDPAFRARLIADGTAACEETGRAGTARARYSAAPSAWHRCRPWRGRPGP